MINVPNSFYNGQYDEVAPLSFTPYKIYKKSGQQHYVYFDPWFRTWILDTNLIPSAAIAFSFIYNVFPESVSSVSNAFVWKYLNSQTFDPNMQLLPHPCTRMFYVCVDCFRGNYSLHICCILSSKPVYDTNERTDWFFSAHTVFFSDSITITYENHTVSISVSISVSVTLTCHNDDSATISVTFRFSCDNNSVDISNEITSHHHAIPVTITCKNEYFSNTKSFVT